MPRKHRRVHHPGTECRCPEGSKRVERCKTGKECKGRSFGCVAMVLKPGGKKPLPRFVKMVCGPEAGPIRQWKHPPGKKKRKKTAIAWDNSGDPRQMLIDWDNLPGDPRRAPVDWDKLPREPQQLPLFNVTKRAPNNPWWWRQ